MVKVQTTLVASPRNQPISFVLWAVGVLGKDQNPKAPAVRREAVKLLTKDKARWIIARRVYLIFRLLRTLSQIAVMATINTMMTERPTAKVNKWRRSIILEI
jgi:hypothetical protein